METNLKLAHLERCDW